MLTTRTIESIRELRAVATAWDDLWTRSHCHLSNHRCESLALFLESWHHHSRLKIITLWRGDKMVAALPLVITRRRGVVPVATSPNNEWFQLPELMIDETSDREAVLRRLLRETTRLNVAWVALDWIRIDDPVWQHWFRLVQATGYVCDRASRFQVGLIDRPDSWAEMTASMSKNARRQLRRNRKRLGERGCVEWADYRQWGLSKALEWALEIEHSGWKGAQGSSIKSHPEAQRFFTRQAEWLDTQDALMLEFLVVDRVPIAFDLGSVSREVVVSQKVSFDETYRSYGPGQLLMAEQISRWCEGQWHPARQIDTVGPITDATRRWVQRTYAIGRIEYSTGSVWGALGLSGIKTLRQLKSNFQSKR